MTPNVAAAARTLGRSPLAAFFEVHLPILRPALVSASLLVFVDCMKELPATLILRPFDFETLATSVFTLASLDQLEESALPALTIVATGLVPVILLSRTLRDRGACRRVHALSATRLAKRSSASGLASASLFFTGAAMHDIAHRELDDLAGFGARNIGDLR